ncbi:hypothetical protein GCM10010448_42760 [Streptomyces glomeratus]|uniref:Uncharacterized protein n=1 Tax=Streptomyces glomeratus TaxID=284452 RepID=A0ABP6LU60_9ACTN
MRRSDEAWRFLGVGSPPVPLAMGEDADNCGRLWGTWGVAKNRGLTTVSTGQSVVVPTFRLSTLFACMPEGNGR